jgi:hypothetical protein
MNNLNDNINRILENEIESILENYMNQGRGGGSREERQEYDELLMELHLQQLHTMNNIVTQYHNQLNLFQENTREMIQLLRTIIQNQNIYNRRNNNVRPTRFTSRRQTSNSYNPPDTLFSYILPLGRGAGNRVPATLTSSQIENATQTVTYHEMMNEERCPITLDNFIAGEGICQIRHCGHIFKRDALMNWFNRNVRCPVCRYDLRNYEPSTETPEQLPPPRATTSSPNSLLSISSMLQGLPRTNRTYTFEIPLYIDDVSGNLV